MSLKYTCPGCGTPLGYDGLCWKCKSEQERKAALTWTPEQIKEKQVALIRNIQRLADMEDPECTDFWQLFGYRDAITPKIQRAALMEKIFYPSEIYYHAPNDVRDALISALLSTEDSGEASNLMCCLAMQGDDRVLETMLELERNPRPWRKKLYVNPSIYAQCGGWTFDKEGRRIQLNFDTCYPMVKGMSGESSPVRIGQVRGDTCPHCGGRMVNMLVLDGREEYKALTENSFVLGKAPVPLFYGGACDDVNTIGGFANWVQDWEYTACPHCGKPMKYLAQIQWDTLMDGTEGTLYIEFCPDCQIVSMQHQQT